MSHISPAQEVRLKIRDQQHYRLRPIIHPEVTDALLKKAEEQGVTNTDIAKATGICGSTISNFFNREKRKPNLEQILLISWALGLAVKVKYTPAHTEDKPLQFEPDNS